MKELTFARRSHREWRGALLAVFAGAALATACGNSQSTTATAPPSTPQRSEKDPIGSLGRIEAGDGIVRVAARGSAGQPIVKRLVVKQGDLVTAGQLIAELDTKEQLDAAVRQAAAEIEVARRRLAQAQAGAKPSDVAAQQTEVERLQTEIDNAQKEYQRYQSLGNNVTASELDRLKLRIESNTRALAGAKQRLASLSEVRPVDVELARASLDQAMRSETRAIAESKTSVVHAPIDGRVVKVHAWPGEAVGGEGLLELAPRDPMYAIAEVAEFDIPRVKVGMRATVSGDGLKKPTGGTVERIGVKVLQNQLMRVDPANFSDARVVEVWVKLDDSQGVADLIHMRVNVVIQP